MILARWVVGCSPIIIPQLTAPMAPKENLTTEDGMRLRGHCRTPCKFGGTRGEMSRISKGFIKGKITNMYTVYVLSRSYSNYIVPQDALNQLKGENQNV